MNGLDSPREPLRQQPEDKVRRRVCSVYCSIVVSAFTPYSSGGHVDDDRSFQGTAGIIFDFVTEECWDYIACSRSLF